MWIRDNIFVLGIRSNYFICIKSILNPVSASVFQMTFLFKLCQCIGKIIFNYNSALNTSLRPQNLKTDVPQDKVMYYAAKTLQEWPNKKSILLEHLPIKNWDLELFIGGSIIPANCNTKKASNQFLVNGVSFIAVPK